MPGPELLAFDVPGQLQQEQRVLQATLARHRHDASVHSSAAERHARITASLYAQTAQFLEHALGAQLSGPAAVADFLAAGLAPYSSK